MLLLVILSTMVLESWADDDQCDESRLLKFSVFTWKNETGYRLIGSELFCNDSKMAATTLEIELVSIGCGVIVVRAHAVSGREGPPHGGVGVPPGSGYKKIDKFGEFKLLPGLMNWTAGVEACENDTARMMILDSKEKMNALYEHFGDGVWLGVSRTKSTDTWKNLLGAEVKPTGDAWLWLIGRPSVEENNCMTLDTNFPNLLGHNNDRCANLYRVVCEKPK